MAQTASPADITAVSNILKKVYVSDEIHSQLNDDAVLWSRLQKTTEYNDSVGDKAVVFTKVGRNIGTSSRPLTGGTLGAAGHQRTQKLEYDYTASYVTIKIIGPTIAKMATARQSAIRAIDLEVNGALLDMKKDLQRQLYGQSNSIIAVCGTTAANATVQLGTGVTNTTQIINNNDAIQNGWLDVGDYIDIGTLANPISRLDGTATGTSILSVVDSDTVPTFTLSTGTVTTTANTDFVFKSGNQTTSSVSYEMNGLQGVVLDSGTVGNLSAASEASWKSTVVDQANTSLSRANMQKVFRLVRKYGGRPSFILTSFNHQEDYYNLLQSQVRFASDTAVSAGSSGDNQPGLTSGPTFNGQPVQADADCPRGVMYFLSPQELFMVTAGDIAWQNVNTGGDVLSWVQTEDSFVARAAFYGNLATSRRRSHGKLINITVN